MGGGGFPGAILSMAGLSLSKRAREVEANKNLAQGIRQLGKAMMVTSKVRASRWLRHVINLRCRRVWRTAVNFVGSCSKAFPEELVEIYKYILDASLLIS